MSNDSPPICGQQELFDQALSLQREGRDTEALRLYQEAEALGLDTAELHSNVGILLQHKGHMLDAAMRFRKAIAKNPKCLEAFNNLGAICMELGLATEAIACFKHFIDTRQSWIDNGFKEIGEALARLRKESEKKK